MPGRIRTLLLPAILAAAIFIVYAPAGEFEFVAFDDDVLVYENTRIREGLSVENALWAFTSLSNLNWVPMARISHMIDIELFGLDPGGHHLSSVVLHALSALLLYVVLSRMTGAPLRSCAVALLFAVHPLHVESVAWVSERRDVLGGLFWILTMWAYSRYALTHGSGSYLAVALFLSLGLMSKPTVVILPLILLLIDYWPLGRLDSPRRCLLEKLPLLGLSLAAGSLTYMAQKRGGAVQSLEDFPLAERVLNVVVSYTTYLLKTIWPSRLTMFYPFPASVPLWKVVFTALLLLLLTSVFLFHRRRNPALLTGWLWYLVTLLPVIGLVQVGVQARADRYMYLPLVGLSITLSWGLYAAVDSGRRRRGAFLVVVASVMAAYTVLARAQARTWRSSQALFEHALRSDPDNWMAENSFGLELYRQGRIGEAMPHYREAIRLRPTYVRAWNNLGVALYRSGKTDEAIEHYKSALRTDPDSPTVLYNLGIAYRRKGMVREAEKAYREALRADPDYADAYDALGQLLMDSRRIAEARDIYTRAVALRPGRSDFLIGLGEAHLSAGSVEAAEARCREALRIDPGNARAGVCLERVVRARNGTH